jgi:hypothetical protein
MRSDGVCPPVLGIADHPALKPIYQQKQKTTQWMRTRNITARKARKLIPKLLELIETLKASGFAPIVTLAKTLANRDETIVCVWRFTKNNGITVCFHRKMKRIQRRAGRPSAYGF